MYRIFEYNPQLKEFWGDIEYRMHLYHHTKWRLLGDKKSLLDFANGHEYFGFHHVDNGWVYREWAPSAHQLYLTGDFNDWQWLSHPLTRLDNGIWEIKLDGDNALWEGCKVKTIVDANMTRTEHIPLYAKRVVQDPNTYAWCCEVIDDKKVFNWTDKSFKPEETLLIYEAHVGMAQEHGHVGTYREFADYTLPHIKECGYNTVQLMAIMEHPYYGSFGYQVSNFFAASSWFGRPEDLKYLVNAAKGRSVDGIVCGLPLNADGTPSIQTEKTLSFVEELKKLTTIPIEFQDERYSTMEAHKVLISEDMSRQKRKKFVDAIAATFILEDFMHRQRMKKQG